LPGFKRVSSAAQKASDPTGSTTNVVSPPIFLKTAIADLIKDDWA
jgi:hypothetical protein